MAKMFNVGAQRPSHENLHIYQTPGSRRLTDSLLRGNNSPGAGNTLKAGSKSSYFQVFMPNNIKVVPSNKGQSSQGLITKEENSNSVRSINSTPLDQLFLSRKNAMALAGSPSSPHQDKSGGILGRSDQFGQDPNQSKGKFTLNSKKNSTTSTLSDPHRKIDALKVNLVEFEKKLKQTTQTTGRLYQEQRPPQTRIVVAQSPSQMYGGALGASASGSVPNIRALIAKPASGANRGVILHEEVFISQEDDQQGAHSEANHLHHKEDSLTDVRLGGLKSGLIRPGKPQGAAHPARSNILSGPSDVLSDSQQGREPPSPQQPSRTHGDTPLGLRDGSPLESYDPDWLDRQLNALSSRLLGLLHRDRALLETNVMEAVRR